MGQASSITCPDSFSVRSYLNAARRGNLEEVQQCLGRRNSDVNATNITNLSAIHLATKEGHIEVVRELLHQNANVNQTTPKGNTPLHIAAMHGQTDVTKLLLENGAHINAKSKFGFTPLYLAVMEQKEETVSLLLEYGADNTIAPDLEIKLTPLKVAEIQEYTAIVKLINEKSRAPIGDTNNS
ncbi:hypothetical protein LSH36_1002g01000 [Paralvinella palmiformis]|uniref:Uncharacterized protein n=1 Tax=Paralvinella palmiformis TaxID=53620 RepID=A0AAD9IW46_9ANNE|nr:hypothetical protein LSH36_1002g01000 [Paralvinella palmiformis]